MSVKETVVEFEKMIQEQVTSKLKEIGFSIDSYVINSFHVSWENDIVEIWGFDNGKKDTFLISYNYRTNSGTIKYMMESHGFKFTDI